MTRGFIIPFILVIGQDAGSGFGDDTMSHLVSVRRVIYTSADNVADNQNKFYIIQQTSEYRTFMIVNMFLENKLCIGTLQCQRRGVV